MTKNTGVTVREPFIVWTHPAHPDGVHAPDAEGLAAIGGIPTASAVPAAAGDKVSVSAVDDLGDVVTTH